MPMTVRNASLFSTLVLALASPLAALGATVNIAASTLTPNVGDTFTVTITADVPNTFAATMGLSFNATTVAFVSGTALSPWNVFVKNSAVTANPTVFDVETPSATAANPGVYNVAQLTFQAIAAGAANILINDDGGNTTGWFDATTADYIPNDYTQATITVASGTAPAVTVSDSVAPADDELVAFGQVTEGTTSATRTFTITNSGTADLVVGLVADSDPLDLPFALVGDTCTNATLTPASSCTLSIDFSPAATGDFTDTLDFPSNAPAVTLGVSGTGIAALVPNIVVTDSVAPANDQAVGFGSVTVNTTGTATVTVTNDGTASLAVGQIGSGLVAPFSLGTDNCSNQNLAPAGSCTVQVEFDPTAVGAASGTLAIPSDDPDTATVNVALAGTGAAVPVADIAVTDNAAPASDLQVPFGDVDLAASATRTVTVTNAGTASLVIGAVGAANPLAAPFSVVTDGCSGQTLAPAATCTVVVGFAPETEESFNDSFSIPSDDPDEATTTVAVSGAGRSSASWPNGGSSALDPASLTGLLLLAVGAGRRRVSRKAA